MKHYGAHRHESEEAKAQSLVREELARLGLTEAELEMRCKEVVGKVGIARQLWQETTMTLAWIARRVQMGVATRVSNLLRECLRLGLTRSTHVFRTLQTRD